MYYTITFVGLGRCVWIYGRRLTRIVRGCQNEPAGCAMFPIKGVVMTLVMMMMVTVRIMMALLMMVADALNNADDDKET